MTFGLRFLLSAFVILSLCRAASVEIIVSNHLDGNANPDDCSPPSNADCNIRSAWVFCATLSNWLTTADNICNINIPSSGGAYSMDTTTTSLPEVEVPNDLDPDVITAFSINLVGSGPGVVEISGDSDDLFLSIDLVQQAGSTADTTPDFHMQMSDIRFSSFGNGASNGGCVNVAGLTTLEMTNIAMDGCHGTNGGGIMIEECYTVTMTGCSFSNNQATVYQNAGGTGGGLYISVTKPETVEMLITDSTFTGNDAVNGGGAYVLGTAFLVVEASSFTSNSASTSGGGLLIDAGCSGCVIDSCTFISNDAGGGNGGGMSIASSSETISLTDTIYTSNSAYSGGGLYINSDNEDITISNISASLNSAIIGAAVTFEGGTRFYINGSNFFNNNAQDDGGALALIRSVNIFELTHSDLTDNYAGLHGGAIYIESVMSNIVFDNLNIVRNMADFQGGGVYMHSLVSGLTISSSVISYNNGTSLGGGIFADQKCSDIAIFKVDMVGNKAPEGDGAALYFHMRHSDINISSSTFVNNEAFQNGGAAVFNFGNERTTFEHNIVSANTAKFKGGGLYFGSQNDEVTFLGNGFAENTASDGCGMMISELNSNIKFYSSTFENNVCSGDGAAILVGSSNGISVISNCSFLDNTALGNGGAVSVQTGNTFSKINDCIFDNNYAASSQGGDGGGAWYLTSENLIVISASSFTNNRAIFNGGAIYSSVNNLIQISSSNFSANYLVGISDDTLETSSDSVLGGAIYTNGVHYNLKFSYCSFLNNSAIGGDGSCGAIYVAGGSTGAEISDSIFSGNSAYSNGGAMCVFGASSLVVSGSTFTENYVNNSDSDVIIGGGAMYFDSTQDVTIEHCAFIKNRAVYFGSAIFSTEGNLITSQYNKYIRNRVDNFGGTLFWDYKGAASPDITSQDDVWIENEAFYGLTLATQGARVNSINKTISVDYFDEAVEMEVELLDFYNNRVFGKVTTEDGSRKLVVISFSATVNDELTGCKDGSTGSISGSTSAFTSTGNATFTDTIPSCDPLGTMEINFALLSSGIYVSDDVKSNNGYSDLAFRACVDGEIYSAQACVTCDLATYSLALAEDYTETECEDAPANSDTTLTYGNLIYANPGYWRVSNLSDSLIECPFGDTACLGGYDSGTDSCQTGYEGPMCGVCSDNYFYDGTNEICDSCEGQDMALFVVCVIPMVAILIFIVFYLARKLRPETFIRVMNAVSAVSSSLKGEDGDDDDDDDSDEDDDGAESSKGSAGYFKRLYRKAKRNKVLKMLSRNTASLKDKVISKVKILLSAFQIVSGLPATLKISFPKAVSKFLNGLSFSNIFSINTSSMSCLSSKRYDYIDTLMFATVLPVVVTAVLYAMYIAEVRIVRNETMARNLSLAAGGGVSRLSSKVKTNNTEAVDKIRGLTGHYISLFLLLTYTILTSVSSTIAGAIPCVQVDPDGVDSTIGNFYLVADLSIDCASDRYAFGFAWACVTALIYPIGIPVMYYILLRGNKEDILNRDINHAKEELRRHKLAKRLARSSSGKITTIDKALIDDQIGDVGDAPHVHEQMAQMVAGTVGRVADAVEDVVEGMGECIADTADDAADALGISHEKNVHKPVEKKIIEVSEKDEEMKDDEDVDLAPSTEHAHTINAFHLQFLHKAYEPQFWYWEIIETMRRLFFTALLVIATTGENLQIVGSIIMAVIFMKLYGFYKPYTDDADDVLQEAAQYQVFFTLFGGLIMRTDALVGIPNINQYISAFIIFVNTLTMIMTPFLIFQVSGSMEDATDQDDDLLEALYASNTMFGWFVQLFPRSFINLLMKSGLKNALKYMLPVQILPDEVGDVAGAALAGAVAYNKDFTGADAV